MLRRQLARDHRYRRPDRAAAGFTQPQICKFVACRAPIDILELCERPLDRRTAGPQRNEAALLIQRVAKSKFASFQLRPI